ncbi:MAG: gamma-glutamyl-gamma-aminobutyrate hydrolase family protein [Clostridia bacterium]|nr:gamma-glutamyl-gamma-aminobutyrate hydrolase family protein [Clostridia bacterium]
MKPLIGITCNYSKNDLGSSTGIGIVGQEWILLASDYVKSVEKAGGVPLLIPFTENIETVFDLVKRCDGILITGGDDVDPTLYGQDVMAQCAHLEPRRDVQEALLLKELLNNSTLPVLGICRGCQILNVMAGGTLYQDLPSQKNLVHTLLSVAHGAFAHTVHIKKDSLLEKIIGNETILTNSYHHQSVKDIAPGFEVIGTTADGVIEAVEKKGDRFVLGVQWHPEMTQASAINHKIFEAFIAACQK